MDAAGMQIQDRAPTLHECLTSTHWDASGQDGPAPREIGRAQGQVAALIATGGLSTPVLDVDVAPTAVAEASAKTAAAALPATFRVAAVLNLAALGGRFTTALDYVLFHTFDDVERGRYVESIASVTAIGGTLYLTCLRDRPPGAGGHRRVSEAELRDPFDLGWRVDRIDAVTYQTRVRTVRVVGCPASPEGGEYPRSYGG